MTSQVGSGSVIGTVGSTPDEAGKHFPALRPDRLVTAFLYWDAQADDARLTLALARTAAEHGATRWPTTCRSPDFSNTPRAASTASGSPTGIEVGAEVVINATGVWSEEVASLSAGGRAASPVVDPTGQRRAPGRSPPDRLPCDYASVLPGPGDKRSIFVVPWAADETPGGIVGGRPVSPISAPPTRTPHGPLDDPRCTPGRYRLPARSRQPLDDRWPHGRRRDRHLGRASPARRRRAPVRSPRICPPAGTRPSDQRTG